MCSEREKALKQELENCFGEGDFHYLSTPGRIEIIGNHTDHQGGRVVASAIDIDNLLCFRKNDNNYVTIIDHQTGRLDVSLEDLSFKEEEKNTSIALIKGIAKRIKELGYSIGGFNGVCDSRVLPGSGISSSACFEMMIVECFNELYCDNKLDIVTKAKIGQYAENVYFGKPCGLMDELTIASGGILAIDFFNEEPIVNKIDFSFADYGYSLVLVNTKADHSNLTNEYASITKEMRDVANSLGQDKLSKIDEETFYSYISLLRNKLNNDRALLRTIHYFEEDKRADKLAKAMENINIDECLKLIRESGNSSFNYLQNVYSITSIELQPLSLALALSEKVLNGKGAIRIHGGGFAGTILAIIPNDLLDKYKKTLENVFGKNSVSIINIK